MWRSRILASLGLLGASIVHASSDNQLTDMTPRDNSQNCDCYLVSGADAGYFQYYHFLDFRSVPNDGDNDYTSPPPLVTASENNGGQNVTSAFFNTAQFNKAWSIEDGVEPAEGDATVAYVNSAQNVFISQDTDTQSTYLTL
ncbi:hypothetical protein PMZ80_008675 [Knufia obscura]|uniref:Uncharacterized protein n=2 Tax=Knufia TaxID=430999 RepID=A0AAN8I6P6_9EURO|nr:hypothetical protein PMZ80_008675 [Knufia obscura]KAK5952131.1 hypothetical protein OHC33_007018 [Knufia fluminis]